MPAYTCSAPNELLILRSDGIQKIHSSKSGCEKLNAGVYDFISYQGEHNLDSILTREQHRPRRMVWERAFTTKGKSPSSLLIRIF